ncbi:DUF3048 domain-containing protein [Butyrivibrio sp. XBB1001]|uniref:DUF3048 domain-containing protein n=1 Tax=Butyrivibrio sp. XBB1001 TaxID=1280682 RepID=UPI0003FB0FB5|nr:DUF3048 domain-containing protein [Butyrivibrio sp. XBB1001]
MFIKAYGKKVLAAILCTSMIASVAACGPNEAGSDDTTASVSFEPITENVDNTESSSSEAASVEDATSNEPYVLPEGMYFSELTGEPISEDIKDQRPIAAMVDNEITALPHYGTSEADVVYELMNSTANDRITRLMVVVKDWGNIEQLGSIRSTRPTNIILASEWNAILCHDGGPYHNDAYFAQPYGKDHISGYFSRVNNGKAREFTEYILPGDLETDLEKFNISATYTELANEGSHFNFVPYGTELTLSEKYSNTYPAGLISLPFKHNQSQLAYNSDTKEYEYYEYGDRHEDAEDGAPLSFKNVILQKCSFNQLDDNGYLIYNCVNPGEIGWYITNGEAKIISWSKTSETGVTKYFDESGNEIEINTGKTYISLIPADSWDSITLQ